MIFKSIEEFVEFIKIKIEFVKRNNFIIFNQKFFSDLFQNYDILKILKNLNFKVNKISIDELEIKDKSFQQNLIDLRNDFDLHKTKLFIFDSNEQHTKENSIENIKFLKNNKKIYIEFKNMFKLRRPLING